MVLWVLVSPSKFTCLNLISSMQQGWEVFVSWGQSLYEWIDVLIEGMG